MEIVIDGIIFENQSNGGISRIYAEILPRMCELSKDICFTLLTAGALKQPVPSHARIHHLTRPGIQRLLPARWFANLQKDLRGLALKNIPVCTPKNAIWHSTNYTLPYQWQGLNILTVPDMIYELFPHLFTRPVDRQLRAYKRKCIEKADSIICISQSAADDLRASYDFFWDKPIHVIPLACGDNFCQLSDVISYYQPPAKKDFLLYVGGRHHYKNFCQLLNVYSVWKLKSEIDMIVVGGQWNETELNLIRDLHLEQNIHLLTMVTDKELCYLYNLAVAFVYPSLYEGFGLPLLEAMQCGCPVVASRIPSSVEVAGDCAIYFEPADSDDFANALTAVISVGRNSRQTEAGLERSRNFSWDNCSQMTLNAYASLLADGNRISLCRKTKGR